MHGRCKVVGECGLGQWKNAKGEQVCVGVGCAGCGGKVDGWKGERIQDGKRRESVCVEGGGRTIALGGG